MSATPARIVSTSGFSRRYTGGVTEFTVPAKNAREMDRLFPGLGGDHRRDRRSDPRNRLLPVGAAGHRGILHSEDRGRLVSAFFMPWQRA